MHRVYGLSQVRLSPPQELEDAFSQLHRHRQPHALTDTTPLIPAGST